MKGIKNYTTEIAADKSISQIENILVEMGAGKIAKDYREGKLLSISFSIKSGENDIPYRLPGNVDGVYRIFKDGRSLTGSQAINLYKQAERTAWKNVREWCQLQAIMVKLQQVEPMEVFLPYMFSMEKQKTAFQLMKEGGFKLLGK